MDGRRVLESPLLTRRVVIALVSWTALWVGLGTATAVELWRLRQLGGTLEQSGEALDRAGSALELVGRIPLVGDGPERLGGEVREAASDVEARGVDVRRSVRSLSILLGVAIAFIPATPLVGVYLPLYLARRRDVEAVRRSWERWGEEPGFEAHLARRALSHLSYPVLRQLRQDGEGEELSPGDRRRLANAELTRLGLAGRPPRG